MKNFANFNHPPDNWQVEQLPLSGNKVIIRTADRKDAPCLFKWWNDPLIMVHVGFPNGLKIGFHEVEDMLNEGDANQNRLIILDRFTTNPIGEMNFHILNDDEATMGLKIGEISFQGLGYGKEALQLLIWHLSLCWYVSRISLEVLEANERACNLYESVGFQLLGLRALPHKEDITGKSLPVHCYALATAEQI